MTELKNNLIGIWKKNSVTICNEKYPDFLEFYENGTYIGKKERIGDFSIWDVGEYIIISNSQIKISTAYDAEIIYEYSISSEKLKFKDNDNCEFQYQRY